ncbi:MAG: YggS family pyridoxal phosphate-dependent enzyme [Pseudonocardiaceae bacterium]
MRADARTAALAAALGAVRTRIEAACAAAGRDPREVRLLAVTKRFPADDVVRLIDLGVREFAESKDQEAGPKAREVSELRPDVPVRWHMVGRLQRNKARSVVRWANEVQSVDSIRLADALAKAVALARRRGERSGPLDVLVQGSLDADAARGGCPLADLPALVDHIVQLGELRLRGLMSIVPVDADEGAAFARLSGTLHRLRATHRGLTELSAGMSGDLDHAIAHGSTCVRVGTALLGGRELASLE